VVPENAKAEQWAKAGKKGVAFTTGPGGKETHWKQGVLLIDNTEARTVSRKEGDQLSGVLEYAVPEDNSRALNVCMTWKFDGEKETQQTWKMR
jgi:protein arginine N-methyltransferase 3